MNKYFVDTGFWKALVDSHDEFHSKARDFWEMAEVGDSHFVTSQMVFAETVTLLRMRQGPGSKTARIWGDTILVSPRTTIVEIDQKIFEKSWAMFKKFDDKQFSFVDCSSFQIMKDLKLREALTFDRHFEQAGFVMLPVD